MNHRIGQHLCFSLIPQSRSSVLCITCLERVHESLRSPFGRRPSLPDSGCQSATSTVGAEPQSQAFLQVFPRAHCHRRPCLCILLKLSLWIWGILLSLRILAFHPSVHPFFIHPLSSIHPSIHACMHAVIPLYYHHHHLHFSIHPSLACMHAVIPFHHHHHHQHNPSIHPSIHPSILRKYNVPECTTNYPKVAAMQAHSTVVSPEVQRRLSHCTAKCVLSQHGVGKVSGTLGDVLFSRASLRLKYCTYVSRYKSLH